jgi:ADP-ribose pyrophosphatase YjhB (NUDIX family)
MLLTSRETRRWAIPKGWPMKGRRSAEAAAQEAYEQAGLIGHIVGKRPIGNFHYPKRLAKGEVLCQVRVFLFRIEGQLDEWSEKGQRYTKWFDAKEVASLVEEGGLAEIIDRFSGSSARFYLVSRRSHLTESEHRPQSSGAGLLALLGATLVLRRAGAASAGASMSIFRTYRRDHLPAKHGGRRRFPGP